MKLEFSSSDFAKKVITVQYKFPICMEFPVKRKMRCPAALLLAIFITGMLRTVRGFPGCHVMSTTFHSARNCCEMSRRSSDRRLSVLRVSRRLEGLRMSADKGEGGSLSEADFSGLMKRGVCDSTRFVLPSSFLCVPDIQQEFRPCCNEPIVHICSATVHFLPGC